MSAKRAVRTSEVDEETHPESDPQGLLLAPVPRGRHEREEGQARRLEETEQESAGKNRPVRRRAGETDGRHAPAKDERGHLQQGGRRRSVARSIGSKLEAARTHEVWYAHKTRSFIKELVAMPSLRHCVPGWTHSGQGL